MNTETEAISYKVKTIIENKLGLHTEDITDYSLLKKDLGADSLDIIELHMELEKEFSMIIPESDFEELHTVWDIVRYIDDRINPVGI